MATNKYKKMREELALTQRVLAKKLDVVQSTISHWEIGRSKPSIKLSKRIAKRFGYFK